MDALARQASRLMLWRSPAGEPRWARPALLSIAAAAFAAYAWQMDGAGLEPYYAASVRSMSMDWHNFVYGAFDPAGTVTMDKLPGAFWLQALSVRLFGLHVWAVVLPQAIEGALTVLVLYRAVDRLGGPVSGLLAAAIFAASPAVVALNRGNISETLATLLLVLAADATSSALLTGRTRTLALAGAWVGLAFQAKMLVAWSVLPALALAYLVAAPGPLSRRAAQVSAAGLVAIAVSLSWMLLVALTPPDSRPYVDGSQGNSVFEQAFVYNGLGRLAGESPLAVLAAQGLGISLPPPPRAGWSRLLADDYGRDSGWLLPAACIAFVAGLVARRREPRTDPIRAGALLWGSWLVVLAAGFSSMSSGWPYYTAMLAPGVAALLAGGVTQAWKARRSTSAQGLVAVVVAISVGYGAWLLPPTGTGQARWLGHLLVAAGVLAVVLVVASMVPTRAQTSLAAAGFIVGVAAVLLVPAVASVSVAVLRLGPFDTPFQPEAVTARSRAVLTRALEKAKDIPQKVERLRARDGTPYLMAMQPGVLASSYIFHGGEKVLPIGGFTGRIPEPNLPRLQSQIARGEFHLVITAPSDDPRHLWIVTHCRPVPPYKTARGLAVHYCVPSDAGSPSGAR